MHGTQQIGVENMLKSKNYNFMTDINNTAHLFMIYEYKFYIILHIIHAIRIPNKWSVGWRERSASTFGLVFVSSKSVTLWAILCGNVSHRDAITTETLVLWAR